MTEDNPTTSTPGKRPHRGPLAKALCQFWGRAFVPGANRLALLCEFARLSIPAEHRYIDVRRGHGRIRERFLTGLCFACGEPRRTVPHHIVQIQNGGRNVTKNLVPVCRACHRKIHPWLAPAKSLPTALGPAGPPRLVRAG